MAEYIDSEPMIEKMQELIDNVSHNFPKATETELIILKGKYEAFMEYIKEQPAADVQPVDSKPVKIVEGDFEVQGYLVKEKYYCCPNCELTFGNLKIDNLLTLVHENKFCKECGQKLDWDSIMSETIKG